MITRKDVFQEIKSPKEIENQYPSQSEIACYGMMIYKAVYMAIRLLLDIRSNEVRIAKHLNIDLGESKTKDGKNNETA